MEKESWAEERSMKSERCAETKIAETRVMETVCWKETRASKAMSGEAVPCDDAGMRKCPVSWTKA